MSDIHNLRRFDLNLLVAFDAVFTERSVTKAARRLTVTQTAVSHALSRLREEFKDPLFVRTEGGMKPTPRAADLAPTIRQALDHVSQVVCESGRDQRDVAYTFRIATTEYFGTVALPDLVRNTDAKAPSFEIIIVPNVLTNAPRLLDAQEIDFAIGYFQGPMRNLLPPRLKAATLLKDHHVCAMRKDHPLARKKLTMDGYLSARHLVFSLQDGGFELIDRLLRRLKVRRLAGLTICHYMAAPRILQESDMIMSVTTRMAHQFKKLYDVHVTPLPFKVPSAPLQLIWNDRTVSTSAVHRRMHSLIVDTCSNL